MNKPHWHLSNALPLPPFCSVLAFHPSAVPICPPPHSPTLPSLFLPASPSEANLICPWASVGRKEVINTAAMTTGEPDTRLSSCILMALLGILSSFNSSSPASTWADIKTPGTDEGSPWFHFHFELFHPCPFFFFFRINWWRVYQAVRWNSVNAQTSKLLKNRALLVAE